MNFFILIINILCNKIMEDIFFIIKNYEVVRLVICIKYYKYLIYVFIKKNFESVVKNYNYLFFFKDILFLGIDISVLYFG